MGCVAARKSGSKTRILPECRSPLDTYEDADRVKGMKPDAIIETWRCTVIIGHIA
jgi:hypothetical protein